MSLDRKTLTGFVVAAALVAAPATAQDSPFSLEARTGVTIPTGDLSDAGAESGLLFGADVFFTVDPALSIYGGWGYYRFGCDACADDVTASGPRLGLKALYHTPGEATPWIRAGATFNQADGLETDASDRAVGLEAGVGIDYELSDRVSITPAARYHTFSPGAGAAGASLSYLTIDLGLHLHF